MASNPWKKFAVGEPSAKSSWTEPSCQPLKEISHVAHIPTALRIAEDGRLRADLVFDQSKLNTGRIRVVWLSPNDWNGADGFRYGNVRFTFDWPALAASKKAFWVESIAYGIEACRILITDNDYSTFLDPYDPKIGDGPWWVNAGGQHYWNGKHCLEIMLEDDLPLTNLNELDFVKHHKKRCNIDPKTCPYRGCDTDNAGAEFLGRLANIMSPLALPGLTKQNKNGLRVSLAVYGAINRLTGRLLRIKCPRHGMINAEDLEAPALARALLRTLANDQFTDERVALASQFISAKQAEDAVKAFLANALGLSSTAMLDPD